MPPNFWNAITPFADARIPEVHEALGVTKLVVGGVINNWHQAVGGLIFQGGTFTIDTDTTVTVNLITPFTSVFLWLGLTILGTSTGFASTVEWVPVDLKSFSASYGTEGGSVETAQIVWFAVGV